MRAFSEEHKPAVYPSHYYYTGERPLKPDLNFKHVLAGKRIDFQGVPVSEASELDCAILGALIKFAVVKSAESVPDVFKMTTEDNEILQSALLGCRWVGEMQEDYKGNWVTLEVKRRRLDEQERKRFCEEPENFRIVPALIYEGLMARVLQISRFLPLARCINPTRGRRVRGGSIIDPVFTPGTPPTEEQKQEQPPPSKMATRDTNIFPVVGAVEVEQFTDGCPVKIGRQFIDTTAEKYAAWFDRVAVVGNGESEPLGILNTPGGYRVASSRGSHGPPVPVDYEAMYTRMPKAFRGDEHARLTFVGSQVSYHRMRAMWIPNEADQRRFFGIDGGEGLLALPYMRSDDAPNDMTACVDWSRYRFYMRPGFQIDVSCGLERTEAENVAPLSTEPKPRPKAVPRLIIFRQRVGGQMESEWAVSIVDNCQA